MFVWIDCEMTGLDPAKDKIIEIACIITNSNLQIVECSESFIIHQSVETMNSMNEWCTEHHGLTSAVLESTILIQEAESNILAMIQAHLSKGEGILAGNSVHMDKIFLMNQMPQLIDYLHYRIMDVSTVKELCRNWNPAVFSHAPLKKTVHRALDDIKESIQELSYYKEHFILKYSDSIPTIVPE